MEEPESIVSKILDSGKTEGWHQYYRFRIVTRQTADRDTETVMGLLNASSTLYSILTMLSVSAIIGAAAFLIVLLIIVFASGRAVRPIADHK